MGLPSTDYHLRITETKFLNFEASDHSLSNSFPASVTPTFFIDMMSSELRFHWAQRQIKTQTPK